MVLVGAAYQSGALPVGADVIEQAITLNGVAVAANVQAFRLGRLAVADAERLRALVGGGRESARAGVTVPRSPEAERLAAVTGVTDGSELFALVVSRVADLVSYQDEGYARGYAEFVGRVRAAAGEGEVTKAVARNLHKLMAYKDEYEIARLALDPAFQREVDATFGPGSKVSYRLHPPLLRAMGLQRKIALGRWFDGAFVGLRAMRRVRGSRADIFGYSRMRRLERELIAEYRGQRRGLATAAAGRHRAAGGRDRGAARSDPGVRGRQAGQRGAVPGRTRIAAGAAGGGRVVGAGGVALHRSALWLDPRVGGWGSTHRAHRHHVHQAGRKLDGNGVIVGTSGRGVPKYAHVVAYGQKTGTRLAHDRGGGCRG